MGIVHWKLLFGCHWSKSLHCSICPNAQFSITNDQLPNWATFFDLAANSEANLYIRRRFGRLRCMLMSKVKTRDSPILGTCEGSKEDWWRQRHHLLCSAFASNSGHSFLFSGIERCIRLLQRNSEVNEDFEDDWGVVENDKPSYLPLPWSWYYSTFLFIILRHTSVSMWPRNRGTLKKVLQDFQQVEILNT